MPPRICLNARQASFVSSSLPRFHSIPLRQHRFYTEKPKSNSNHDAEPKGPNMDQLPHVSEEAAALSKIKGEQGPEVEEQGTPVAEVAKGDDIEKHLPQVMKDQIRKDKPNGSRSYSTLSTKQFRLSPSSARHFSTSSYLRLEIERAGQLPDRASWQPAPSNNAEEQFDDEFENDYEEQERLAVAESNGLKFGLEPLPPQSHLRKRYDPLIEQVTKLFMRDGKLATAQKNMSIVLAHLATSPAPRLSPNRSLLMPSIDPSLLPLNPRLYLSTAIDSVAPLLRIRSQKGAAGGGMALQIPVPLRLKQRRRTAIKWMLDAVEKRKDSVSPFAKRFAEEVVAIVEGRSAVWEKRTTIHATGIRARVNVNVKSTRKRF